MTIAVDLYGIVGEVRKQQVRAYSDGDQKIPIMNERGELTVSTCLPPRTELARLGQTWNVKIANANAFTFVAGYPATTGTRAELVLYNGEAVGSNKVYVLDSAWVAAITSMAAAGSIALLGQTVVAPSVPTDNTAHLITGRTGRSYPGKAKRAVAQTSAITDKWELLAPSQSGGGATAQIGLAAWADLYGAWILQPGDMFALNCIAGTAAGTAIAGITWHELTLSVG